ALFWAAVARIEAGKEGLHQFFDRPLFASSWNKKNRLLFLALLAGVCILIAAAIGWDVREVIQHAVKEYEVNGIAMKNLSFVCIVLCITFMLLEVWWGKADNRRALWLLAGAYIMSVALLAISLSYSGEGIEPRRVRLVQ